MEARRSRTPNDHEVAPEASLRHNYLLTAIRDLILEGGVSRETRLSETELAQRFGVSRTPVREVLKQLQREGLVETYPRIGSFVREPSAKVLSELFDIREMLEGLAARLAATRGRTSYVDEMEENIDESRRAASEGDRHKYAQLVVRFHNLMVDSSNNSSLVEHHRRVVNRLMYHQMILRTIAASGRIELSLAEHERILAYIVQEDKFGAEQAMREHDSATSQAALYATARERTQRQDDAP